VEDHIHSETHETKVNSSMENQTKHHCPAGFCPIQAGEEMRNDKRPAQALNVKMVTINE
jgi:hypothetical protein